MEMSGTSKKTSGTTEKMKGVIPAKSTVVQRSKSKFTVAVGCDHRGLAAKEKIISLLRDQGHTPTNLGTDSSDACDYPDIARRVADSVAGGYADRGILICSTGIGMSIAANKVKGIRAARCCSIEDANMTRKHNDANVLCLSEKTFNFPQMLLAFLGTKFEGGRHQERIDKIE